MRIVVNDIAASSGGAMTILQQFYHYIKEHDTDNEWIFMLGDKYLDETKNIRTTCFPKIKKNHIKKIIFDCFSGRKIIDSYHPDVVVSLQNIIMFGVKVPQIVYVHQAIPFQDAVKFSFFKSRERGLAVVQYVIGAFIIASVKRADKVVVQTEWMRDAVSRNAKIEKDKIITAFPNVQSYEQDETKYQLNKFFYPTGREIYKNVNVIVEACNLLNDESFSDYKVHITLPHGTVNHPNIECVGYLTQEQMQAEYQSGTLLFPSYIETVGLPMLEAKSCGTMILASDTPFSHECLDGYENVKFCSAFNAQEWKQEMKSVMDGNTPKIKAKADNHGTKDSWNEFYWEILQCKKSYS